MATHPVSRNIGKRGILTVLVLCSGCAGGVGIPDSGTSEGASSPTRRAPDLQVDARAGAQVDVHVVVDSAPSVDTRPIASDTQTASATATATAVQVVDAAARDVTSPVEAGADRRVWLDAPPVPPPPAPPPPDCLDLIFYRGDALDGKCNAKTRTGEPFECWTQCYTHVTRDMTVPEWYTVGPLINYTCRGTFFGTESRKRCDTCTSTVRDSPFGTTICVDSCETCLQWW